MTFEEMTQQLDQLTPDEQLRLLEVLSGKIRRRLKVADETPSDDDEPTLEEIREGIKEGLREAMRGEGIPVESLLQSLKGEGG